MIYDNADEVSKELFGSLLNKYQIRWKHPWKVVFSFNVFEMS